MEQLYKNYSIELFLFQTLFYDSALIYLIIYLIMNDKLSFTLYQISDTVVMSKKYNKNKFSQILSMWQHLHLQKK